MTCSHIRQPRCNILNGRCTGPYDNPTYCPINNELRDLLEAGTKTAPAQAPPAEMRLIYTAFPYSDDPIKRTAELKAHILNLLSVRKDIVPFAPHFAFDAILDYPVGYSNLYLLEWELVIISRCDAICFPPPTTPAQSMGCAWERAFARFLGVPILDFDSLLKMDEPNLEGDSQ